MRLHLLLEGPLYNVTVKIKITIIRRRRRRRSDLNISEELLRWRMIPGSVLRGGMWRE